MRIQNESSKSLKSVQAPAVRKRAPHHIARLAEKTYRQPIPLADLIVAATAVRHGLTLLTYNTDDMGRLGIGARDPFAKLPPDA